MTTEENAYSLQEYQEDELVEVEVDLAEYFKQGLLAYRKKDYDNAIEIFSSIIEAMPELVEAHINLGNAYFKVSRKKEAIDCWKTALKIEPDLVNCYVNIGNAYYSDGNVEEAIAHWQVAATFAPDHKTVTINLGTAHEGLGNHSLAFKYYDLFLKYNSTPPTLDFQRIYIKVAYQKRIALKNLKLGVQYQRQNKLRQAAQAYLKSIESYPNFSKAHLNMGSICYMADKLEEAIHYWLNAIKLDPKNEKVYCNLGVAYDRLKKTTYAYCFYKRYLEFCSPETKEYKEITKRLDSLLEEIKGSSDKIENHLHQAESYFMKKQLQDALIEYQNYTILKPDGASKYESRIKECNDFSDPATCAARKAFEIGQECMDKDQVEKAMDAFKRCIKLDPTGEYGKMAQRNFIKCAKLMGKAVTSLLKSRQNANAQN